MPTVRFRKDFQADKDTHVWNLRLLEDWMDAPVDATDGSFSGVITTGNPNAQHVDIGFQNVDGTDYYIIAWDADTIVSGLQADGTWS